MYSKYTVRHMGIRHGSYIRASTTVQGSSVPWIQVRESEKAKTTEEAGDRRLTRKNHTVALDQMTFPAE